MTMFYCPRGCQTCDEPAAAAFGVECGACGSTMTEDSARYDAFHDDREDEQIAQFERDIEAFRQACRSLAQLHVARFKKNEVDATEFHAANRLVADTVAAMATQSDRTRYWLEAMDEVAQAVFAAALE